MAEGIQKRLQTELDKFQTVQKEISKHVGLRQQLESQLSENTLVKEELDRLEDGSGVYKMVGPALIKQELPEAKQNVQKRIDYITGELCHHKYRLWENIQQFHMVDSTALDDIHFRFYYLKENIKIQLAEEKLKRHENVIKDLDKKADAHRESLSKLQHQFQQAQVKAAAKS